MTQSTTTFPHVEAILNGTRQTLGLLFGGEFPLSEVRSRSASEPMECDISVIVGFVGDVTGQIMLSMDQAVALSMAGTLMMSPFEAFDAIARSAIGEVANMVAGNCATNLHNLGLENNITVPTVVAGSHVQFSWPNLTIQEATVSLPFGDLNVVVGLKLSEKK